MDDRMVQNALAIVPTTGLCAKRLVGIISLLATPSTTTPGVLHLLPEETASSSVNSIRDRLCERLPAYMVPSLWIAIVQFPLMPSGKMDRRRVAQWLEQIDKDTYRAISTVGHDSPRDDSTPVELKLQKIFANALGLPQEDIRLNQSFLHLGGDSIAAMQVVSIGQLSYPE